MAQLTENATVITEPQTLAQASGETKRYVMVDAFRGYAAIAVVFFHLVGVYTPLRASLLHALPAWAVALMQRGNLGVEVFFVISGFVITHSLRHTILTPRSVGWFIVRRQVRLDPPYWIALALQLCYLEVWHTVFGATAAALPPAGTIALNLVYLQRIFDVPSILFVSWTLCIEIQFYLFFIGLLWVFQGGRPGAAPIRASIAALVVSGIASTAFAEQIEGRWMLPFWCYFAAGSLCYYALKDYRFVYALLAVVVAMCFKIIRGELLTVMVGVGTTCIFLAAGRAERLTRWTLGRYSQFLGRISYSLYLTHSMVVIGVLSVASKVKSSSPGFTLIAACAAIAASILVASVFNLCVEQPSMRLTKALKLTR